MKALLVSLCLLMLVACNHQPPELKKDAYPVNRQLNMDGTYTVRTGDTLYAISFGFGLDHNNVAAWNDILSPYVIYPGQRLRLSARGAANTRNGGKSSGVQVSGIKTPGKASTRTNTTSTNATSTNKAGTNKISTRPAASTVSKTTAKTSVPKQTATPPATKPKSSTAVAQKAVDPGSWKWPANGRVLRGYVAGNPSRNGLDIAGKEGQPIKAAAAGKVVYSGNGLIGYGELIIIKHSEKMLSAYAHNKRRLVQEGEQVSGGQKIAEMGRNDQNEQLLHFEIRLHGKPVNPMIYLPRK